MKRWIVALLILLFTMLILAITFLPFKSALIFYKENTNEIAAFLPVQPQDEFQIIFTHSIHLTDVVEKYRIKDNFEIEQFEIVFEHFGIGMPSNAQEGETFIYKDGKYAVRNLQNNFEKLKIRNGKTVSKNRLVWGFTESTPEGHKIWFNQYFKPGAWFTLKVEKMTLLDYWKEVKIHE